MLPDKHICLLNTYREPCMKLSFGIITFDLDDIESSNQGHRTLHGQLTASWSKTKRLF